MLIPNKSILLIVTHIMFLKAHFNVQSIFFSSDFSKIETINKTENLHSMEALEKAKQLCLKIIFSVFIRFFSVRHFYFLNKFNSILFIYIIYYLAYRLTLKKASSNTTLCIFNSHPVHHTKPCVNGFFFETALNSLICCCKVLQTFFPLYNSLLDYRSPPPSFKGTWFICTATWYAIFTSCDSL